MTHNLVIHGLAAWAFLFLFVFFLTQVKGFLKADKAARGSPFTTGHPVAYIVTGCLAFWGCAAAAFIWGLSS